MAAKNTFGHVQHLTYFMTAVAGMNINVGLLKLVPYLTQSVLGSALNSHLLGLFDSSMLAWCRLRNGLTQLTMSIRILIFHWVFLFSFLLGNKLFSKTFSHFFIQLLNQVFIPAFLNHFAVMCQKYCVICWIFTPLHRPYFTKLFQRRV